MGKVTAGWALYGKRPGSSDDYGVLNHSREPFAGSSYGKILRRYRLGTPPPDGTVEGGLPWVAVSWVGEQPDRYLGMSVEYWTDHRDGAGRSVSFTKYVAVPYSQLQAAPASYAALYHEVLRLDLPMDGDPGEGAELTLPKYDPEALARDIVRFGTERVMQAAAMLLDGKVDVVHAGEAPIRERLAFLDAVMALLPYGYRAAFTGGTWAASSADNIRLLFVARRARPGSRELAWRGPDDQPRLSPTARSYLDRLHRLLNHTYESDLSRLVAYLSGARVACDFGDAGNAVRYLADVEWPREVVAAVRSGTAKADGARRLLGDDRLHELSQAERTLVLEHVVRAADPDDLELIEQRWDELAAAGAAGDLTGALAAAGAALLWRAEPDERISRYVQVARRRNFSPWFLGELVQYGTDSGLQGPGYRAARTLAANLIRDHVDPFDPGAAHSPLVRQAGRDREIVTALLAEEPAWQRIAAWTGWLGTEFPDLMAHFRTVLDDRDVDVNDLRGLAQGEPTVAVTLVWVAARLERLGRVLPAMIGWLGERGEPSPQARDLAIGALSQAEPPDFKARGASDAVLLMLGSTPCHLDGALGHTDFQQYQSGFLWTWGAHPGRTMEQRLVMGLANALRERPWGGAPARADDVINLARALVASADRDWDPLASVLAENRPDELLARRPAYSTLRALLRPHDDVHPPAASTGAAPPAFGAVPFESSERGDPALDQGPADAPMHGQGNGTVPLSAEGPFGHIRPDTGMDDVGAAYLNAVLIGHPAPSALRTLFDRGRHLTTTEVLHLARRIEYEVTGRYGASLAAERAEQLVRAALNGAMGADVAAELRDEVAGMLSEQLKYRARLLEVVALGDESWQPPEYVRIRLEEAKKRMDDVAKQGRGRRLPRVRRKSGDE